MISLKYSGLHSHRPGACTPAFTNVPRALRTRTPTSNVSRLADGVVDDVDRAGVGHRQPLQRLPQPAAAPGDELLDDGQAGLVREHLGGAEPRRQLRLRIKARDHRHRHLGIERLQDRDRAQAEGAGAVDERPGRTAAAGAG